MSEVMFPPNVNMTLAIGRLDAAPSAGSFRISYGSSLTSAIPFNATDVAVQSALNAIPAISTEGGVSVTKINTTYRIIWNNTVAPSNTLAVASNELYPNSTIGISEIRQGSSTVREIYQVHIKQAPVANITSFINQDNSAITVTSIHTAQFSGDSSVWRFSIEPEPRDGSFLLSFNIGALSFITNPLPIEATALQVAEALNQQFSDSWSCVKTGKFSWDVSVGNSSIFNFGFNDAGLISFNSKYGVLDLNTAEVEDLLAGTQSARATMEIEVEASGTRQTILQTEINILNDLIDSDSYTTVTWGDVMPVDSVVRYDTSQILTSSQQQQARDNIGAIDATSVGNVNNDITVIMSRLTTLELNTVTENQKEALDAAPTLSALNPILSKEQIETLLDDKSDVGHQHTIEEVVNLATSLSQKANNGHTHLISDITDLNFPSLVNQTMLNNALATKANVDHTHSIFSSLSIENALVTNLTFIDNTTQNTAGIPEAPTDGIKYSRIDGGWLSSNSLEDADFAAIQNAPALTEFGFGDASPTATNHFMTYNHMLIDPNMVTFITTSGPLNNQINVSTFPLELKLLIGGQVYCMPMRWDGPDGNFAQRLK